MKNFWRWVWWVWRPGPRSRQIGQADDVIVEAGEVSGKNTSAPKFPSRKAKPRPVSAKEIT